MSRLRKQASNQIGATLIEVLVVAGIMGVLAIFSTQLFSDVIKMQKLAEQKFGVVFLKNEIYQLLNSNLACTQSFAGHKFAYGATGSASVFDIKQLKLATGEVVYRTFDDPAQPGAVYENRNLRIRSIKLSDYKPNETPTDATDSRFYTGTALVKVDFERNTDSVGPGQFSREIKVSVVLKREGDLSGGLGSPAYDAAEDKTIRNCMAMGSGSTESFWATTPANNGIFYSGGNVGIGTSVATEQLIVNGAVKIGSSIVVNCDPASAGVVRYRSPGPMGVMEYCNGTDWLPVGGGRGYTCYDSAWYSTFDLPVDDITTVANFTRPGSATNYGSFTWSTTYNAFRSTYCNLVRGAGGDCITCVKK